MIASRKNWYGLLWLTTFLLTGGVWVYFDTSAFAQNAGNITITINKVTVSGNTTLITNPSNPALSTGGNISITTSPLIIRRVPEPSSTLGLLAFVVVSAVSIRKFKQKCRQF
ncbi:PEP-CTERM sorting domain-containing protein [Tolypothrix bouteillei VB521301_2]